MGLRAGRWLKQLPCPRRVVARCLLEQNDKWLPQHRYMQIEGMAELTPPLIDVDPVKLPPMAA
jgi:putative transposase